MAERKRSADAVTGREKREVADLFHSQLGINPNGHIVLADLFHSQLGINPNGYIVLVDRGYDLYSQGQEDGLEYAQAQLLLDESVTNFEEGAAMALVQAGNAYMCAARTKKEKIPAQLHTAYERVKNGYQKAERMYKQALTINPGLYVGLRSLGQQQLEMAKLEWFFALQQGIDLSDQDLEEVFKLFDKAKEYMNDATKARTSLELAEQAKIHNFWGNLLFERSQVEYKYGLAVWESNLELAIKYFEDAGASEAEVAIVTNNHFCKTGESVVFGKQQA